MREMKDSGVEWIGEVPAEWDVKRSKSCVLTHKNGNWGDDQGTSELDCICVRAADFDYEHLRFKPSQTMVKRSYTYSQFERVKLRPLDIVIEKSGGGDRTPVGRAVLYRGEFEAAYSNFMERIAVNADITLPAFFFYWWTANYQARWFVPFFNQTTGIQNLNTYDLLNEALIVLPSLSEQQRIVSYLDGCCAAIDEDVIKRREVIEKLKEYKKSLIAHVVTKGLDPNVEMKDSGVEWIGKVPSSWEMLRIYQLAFPVRIKNEGMKEDNLLSLSYGRIIQKDINTVDGLVPANYEGYNIIEPGDIVLRFTDLQNDQRSLRTGLCSYNGIITSAYLTIRPQLNLVSSEYLHYVLHFVDTLKVFYNMGGGMRQSLDWRGISHMFLPIPPRAEQRWIVSYLNENCDKIDEAIARQEQLIEKLGEYRKSLIHHAVTGKIDCTEA
ncbi:MAG: restriction endonuclease subunit S [Collinsella intestinalis]|nr:restriction endonuclease subunit S [Collinsella intestinalis]